MAAVWRLVEVLGAGVLRVVSSSDGAHAEIGDVTLQDPGEPLAAGRGDLVLAIGAGTDPDAAIALVAECGRAGVSAVACKPPAGDSPAVARAADDAGVALLRVEPQVAWGQLYLLARDAVASAGEPVDRQASSIRLGDLFAVADVIAARAGGPVTIEDSRARVLAYSDTAEEDLDEPRRQTILGRRVPDEWVRHLEDTDTLRRLWSTDDVIELPPLPSAGLRRRLTIRVRAGKQLLGAVWLAEGRAPLDDEVARAALEEAARFVALHLLAHQSKDDIERRVRGDLLRQLLDGDDVAEQVAERFGIAADEPCTVLAFCLTGVEGAEAVALRDNVINLIALHSEAFRWQAASIWLEGVVYTLLPTAPPPPPERLRALAADLVERIRSALGVTATAGVGATVPSLRQVAHSRRDADLVLRALALRGGSAATIDDVSAQRVLFVLQDLAAEHPELHSSKVDALLQADAEHGSVYVGTLRAFLDAFGSIPKAAEDLGVHPNTLRYRLRRALEIADLDLEDADERVAVEVGLRLLKRD